MQGLMQHWSMTLDTILTHAATAYGDRAIVAKDIEGHVHISDYAHLYARARQMSGALIRFGIRPGDRVGSLMWNDLDHLALWYGAMAIGAVLHTLNPRLGASRIGWIATHGGDRLIVCGEDMVALLDEAAGSLDSVEHIVVAGAGPIGSQVGGVPAQSMEDFLQDANPAPIWGDFDENAAAGLCYTSGTTGDPKGVLYSHRSNMLHALTINQPGGFGIGPADVVLAIVPMFHANGWALPFIAPIVGAELVLPGRDLTGPALARLIARRGVTFAAGVPTIWQDFVRHLDETGTSVPTLRRVVIGGAAPSRDLVAALDARGISVMQGWGMTEMSPIGSMSASSNADTDDRLAAILRQGRTPFPVQAEIFDAQGVPCAHDDKIAGTLKVRGPNVVARYFGAEDIAADATGWFETGDIAVIDAAGSIRLVDRAKDVIKSGGEWISSIELENLAMSHPDVRRAAVIAMPDPRWGERPLLVVEADSPPPSLEAIIDHIRPSVPTWWLPRHIDYRSIPLGATGKIDKLALRRELTRDGQHILVRD